MTTHNGFHPNDPEALLGAVLSLQVSLDAREKALDKREAELKEREERLRSNEDRLSLEKDRLSVRELKLVEREERAAARDTSDWEMLRAEQKSISLARQGTSKSAQAESDESEIQIDTAQDVVTIHNVPLLLKRYRASGGVPPTTLLVAEVDALQKAATTYQDQAESVEVQVQQLKKRLTKDIPSWQRESATRSMEKKESQKRTALELMNNLLENFKKLRMGGIKRLVPLMYKSAVYFDTVFDEAINSEVDGETILARIGEICASCPTKGNNLRQVCPSSWPPTSLHTLLLLLEKAVSASKRLQRLMDQGVSSRRGCQVLPPPSDTKGIERALEKTQSEYKGDYTRLLDYTRTTVVCETLGTMEDFLTWLTTETEPVFKVCRIKDRISREGGYDPETSGGNRDVLVNGWLDLGVNGKMIAEVQVHLLPLYNLKADLHVLYDDARVLGVADPAIMSHEGNISKSIIEQIDFGTIRQVRCQFSTISKGEIQYMSEILKRFPCFLLELDIGYAVRTPEINEAQVDEADREEPVLQDWTLEQFLVPETRTLACSNIRKIGLYCLGLVGVVPEELQQCRALQSLDLGYNFLEGPLPEWLADLPKLDDLQLEANWFSGTVDLLMQCKKLKRVHLHNNCLEGELPPDWVPALAAMDTFFFGIENRGAGKQNLRHFALLDGKAEWPNKNLRVTSEVKDDICALWNELNRKNQFKFNHRSRKLDKENGLIWPEMIPSSG